MQSTNPIPHPYTPPYTGPAPQQTPASHPASQPPVPHLHAVAHAPGSALRQTLAGQFRSELYAAGASAKTTETLAELAAGLDAALFETGALIPLQLVALNPQMSELVAGRLAANLYGCFESMPPVNTVDADEAMLALDKLEKALRREKSAQAETVGAIYTIIENLLEYLELIKHTTVARPDLLIDLAADDPETLQQARSALLDSVATGIIRIGASTAAKPPMPPALPAPGTTGSSAMRAPWLDQAPRIVAPGSAQQSPGAAVGAQRPATPVAYPAPQPLPYPASAHAHGYNELIYQQQPLPMSTDATSFLPSSAQASPSAVQQPVATATPPIPAPETKVAPSAPVPDPAPQLTPRSSKKPGRFKQLLQKLSVSKRQQVADAGQGAQPEKQNVADGGGHDSWGSDNDDADHDANDGGGKTSQAPAPVVSVDGQDSVSEDSTDGGTTGAPENQVLGGGIALQKHRGGDLVFCTPAMLLTLLRAYNEPRLGKSLKKIATLLHMLPQNQSALIPDLIDALVSNANTSRDGRDALRKAARTLRKCCREDDPVHILASEILRALRK